MTKDANTKLTLECFDRDFIKFSDHIGKVEIDLKDLIDDCSNTKKMQQLTKNNYDDYLSKESANKENWKRWKDLNLQFQDKRHFWVEFFAHKDGKKTSEMTGKVRL